MNKKQLIFYAFMLTFGIACGDGSVKNSEDTTLTQDGNATQNGNATKNNNATKDGHAAKYDFSDEPSDTFLQNYKDKKKPLEKVLNDDNIHLTDKDDNFHKDNFPDEPIEYFFTNCKDNLKPLEEILNKNNTKENLMDKEEFAILNTFKALETLVIKPMSESAGDKEEKYKSIVNLDNLEILQTYLSAYILYDKYINRNNKDTPIRIQCLKSFEELLALMNRVNFFFAVTNLTMFDRIENFSNLAHDDTIKQKINIPMDTPCINKKRFDDDNSLEILLNNIDTNQMLPTEKKKLNVMQDAVKRVLKNFSIAWKECSDAETKILQIIVLNFSLNDFWQLFKLKKTLPMDMVLCSNLIKAPNCKIITLDDQIKKIKSGNRNKI